MRKNSLRISLMIAVLAILSVSYASAQSSNEQTANIPFAFSVGDKTFPAGEYRVKRLNPQSDKAVVEIRSADGSMSKISLTTPVQAPRVRETSRLVFNRYGDQYYLAQVWAPADDTGMGLAQSGTEQKLAKSRGGERPEVQTVALVARRR